MAETREKRSGQVRHDCPLELELMENLDPAAAGPSVCFTFSHQTSYDGIQFRA